MKTAISVKAQIKDIANKEKRNVQDMFILYVLERVLYRLSVSPYKDKFILKGGCLEMVSFQFRVGIDTII